jgi:hypothetical protein
MELGRTDIGGVCEPRPRRSCLADLVCGHRRHRWSVRNEDTDRAGNTRDRDNSKHTDCLASKQLNLLIKRSRCID